jgi:hypothetical protein
MQRERRKAMKKTFFWILILSLSLMLINGCGGGSLTSGQNLEGNVKVNVSYPQNMNASLRETATEREVVRNINYYVIDVYPTAKINKPINGPDSLAGLTPIIPFTKIDYPATTATIKSVPLGRMTFAIKGHGTITTSLTSRTTDDVIYFGTFEMDVVAGTNNPGKVTVAPWGETTDPTEPTDPTPTPTPVEPTYGAFAGVVRDITKGAGLGNLVVEVAGLATLTNADGTFTINNVPGGEYTYRVNNSQNVSAIMPVKGKVEIVNGTSTNTTIFTNKATYRASVKSESLGNQIKAATSSLLGKIYPHPGETFEDSYSLKRTLSMDGRYVVFFCKTNLLKGATGEFPYMQIWCHDRITGVTQLISKSNVDGSAADGDCHEPYISHNGRFIVFTSIAENLNPYSKITAGSYNDIYIWDRESTANQLRVVTYDTDGAGRIQSSEHSRLGSVSESGVVAFQSYAKFAEIAEIHGTTNPHIFIRDMGVTTEPLKLVSRKFDGTPSSGSNLRPMISNNGGFVVFESDSPGLLETTAPSGTFIYVRDLGLNKNILCSTHNGSVNFSSFTGGGPFYSRAPAISDDGKHVVFESDVDLCGFPQTTHSKIYRRTVNGTTTEMISLRVNTEGAPISPFTPPNDHCRNPGIRGINGDNLITFDSAATNIVTPQTTPGRWHVYTVKMPGNHTTLVSTRADGTEAQSYSQSASVAMTPDGTYVSLMSYDQLTEGMVSGYWHVFLKFFKSEPFDAIVGP